VKQWTNLDQKDTLYFLDYKFHSYVLPYITERKLAYIADGDNLFRDCDQLASEIRELFGVRLILIAFDQQLRVDHCASSAILIAIELLRMYRRKIRFQKLICKASLREALVRSFHGAESKPMQLPSLKMRRQKLKCSFCDKCYKSNEGRALDLHILRNHQDSLKKN